MGGGGTGQPCSTPSSTSRRRRWHLRRRGAPRLPPGLRLAIKFDRTVAARVGFSSSPVERSQRLPPSRAGRASPPYRPLRECLNRLKSQRELEPCGNSFRGAGHSDACCGRFTAPTEADRAHFDRVCHRPGIDLYLQAADEQIEPLRQQSPSQVTRWMACLLHFASGDFIQVAGPVNQRMVSGHWAARRKEMTRCWTSSAASRHLPAAFIASGPCVVEGEFAMVTRAGRMSAATASTTPPSKADRAAHIAGHVLGPEGSIWYWIRQTRGAGGDEPRGGIPQTGGLVPVTRSPWPRQSGAGAGARSRPVWGCWTCSPHRSSGVPWQRCSNRAESRRPH